MIINRLHQVLRPFVLRRLKHKVFLILNLSLLSVVPTPLVSVFYGQGLFFINILIWLMICFDSSNQYFLLSSMYLWAYSCVHIMLSKHMPLLYIHNSFCCCCLNFFVLFHVYFSCMYYNFLLIIALKLNNMELRRHKRL